ncbi:hypothetical protein [Moraxella lacunata]|mgnify:FL=1|nr:hypothetical protein [Moraxella lacunata]
MEFKSAYRGGIIGGMSEHTKQIQVSIIRELTSAEIAMARRIFKNSINYQQVKICRGNPFHNLTGNAQVLGNNMTFPADIYDKYSKGNIDFSNTSDKNHQVWFIHEMVHIWQNQLGSSTLKHGACIFVGGKYFGSGGTQNGQASNSAKAYDYDIVNDGIDFPDYSLEQQAEVISHYFDILKFGQKAKFYSLKTYYEKCLAYFLKNPNEPLLLPKNIKWTECFDIIK